MIADKRVTIIISQPRSGTTTLCDKLSTLPGHGCMYEAFNSDGTLYIPQPELKNYTPDSLNEFIRSKITESEWLSELDNISFKIFQRDDKHFDLLMQTGIIDRAIILKRCMKDNYNSYRRALVEGDWATNPENRKNGIGVGAPNVDGCTDKYHTFQENEIKSFDAYSIETSTWYDHAEKTFILSNTSYKTILFEQVISSDFDVQSIL